MLLPLGVSLWVRRDMRLFSLYLVCNLIPFILNQYFVQSILFNSIISFTAHLILFTGTIALYSDILLLHWQEFLQLNSAKWWLIGGSVLAIFGIIGFTELSLVALLESAFGKNQVGAMYDVPSYHSKHLSLLGSFIVFTAALGNTLFTAIINEILFRHVLFMEKLYVNPRLILWLTLSSLLYGLTFWYSLGQDWIATLPYMLVGAWLAWLYYKGDNLWYCLFISLIYSLIQVLVIPLLFIVYLELA